MNKSNYLNNRDMDKDQRDYKKMKTVGKLCIV